MRRTLSIAAVRFLATRETRLITENFDISLSLGHSNLVLVGLHCPESIVRLRF